MTRTRTELKLATEPEKVRHLSVIPDCCNIGIIFRALLVVNGAVLVGILLRSSALQAGLQEFLEACMLVEPACLLSLLAVCGLRREAMRAVPRWAQRVCCAVVPAAVTAVLIHFLSSVDWIWDSFPHLSAWKGALAAAALGALLQPYLELRAQAFSPALLEARLQALQARIRPHFLFNSLNAVLSLVRSEPRRAESTLEDLADLFRVLMSDPRSMTTLQKEVELCRQYLNIEQIRLGERLIVDWQISNLPREQAGRVRIPVLLLQPLIENAVHHGVEPVSGPVTIQIHVSRMLDRLQIVVRNPFHPDAAVEKGNHMALDNIRERLALLYDVEAQLVTTISNEVFEVKLRFPYQTETP